MKARAASWRRNFIIWLAHSGRDYRAVLDQRVNIWITNVTWSKQSHFRRLGLNMKLHHACNLPNPSVCPTRGACCPRGERGVWQCSTRRRCSGLGRVRRCCWCLEGRRFAPLGRLTWRRGLPLPQRVSQPLGADVSRVGVSGQSSWSSSASYESA